MAKWLWLFYCVAVLSDENCLEPNMDATSEAPLVESVPEETSAESSTEGCGCGHALNRQNVQHQQDASSSTTLPSEKEQQEPVVASAVAAAPKNGESDEVADLVQIAGGEFIMGANPKEKGLEEGPPRRVRVSPFAIGRYEVSNARFDAFVRATGYVTEAEKFNWSFGVEVLIPEDVKSTITQAVAAAPWWLPVQQANWRHPNGPGTDMEMNHPVTQVSYADAEAFCAWSVQGGRLPTEAEWEFAARGALERKSFPWGDKLLTPNNTHRCNIWQSSLPISTTGTQNFYTLKGAASNRVLQLVHEFYNSPNSLADGYLGTAPVDAFGPQNAFGLFNMVGNVWEWVSDWYVNYDNKKLKKLEREQQQGKEQQQQQGKEQTNPNTNNNDMVLLVDPKGPPSSEFGARVKRGGSFLCHRLTCDRYRSSARMMLTPDSAASNVGFRCAAPATTIAATTTTTTATGTTTTTTTTTITAATTTTTTAPP